MHLLTANSLSPPAWATNPGLKASYRLLSVELGPLLKIGAVQVIRASDQPQVTEDAVRSHSTKHEPVKSGRSPEAGDPSGLASRSASKHHFGRSFLYRYGISIVAVAVAVLIRVMLVSRFGELPTYITFYPFVLVVALLGGMWPGILATALSALAADYWAIPPIHNFAIARSSDAIGLGIFCFSGIGVSMVAEGYRRNREKLTAHLLEEAIQKEQRKADESRRLAEAVDAERKRFFDVLEALPRMISLLTPDHRVVFANRSYREKFGDPGGQRCFEARFGRNEPCEFCESYKPLNTGQPHHWDVILPDGTLLEAYEYPFTDADGSPLILEMKTDVTERKRAEAALRESEEAFVTLANHVPQFVWMCTPDGLNVYFNERWVKYTGLTLEESYGRGWNTPFHPDDKQTAWDNWNCATQTGEPYTVESRLRAADGSYRWFLMRGEPLKDEKGEIVRWFGSCTDIDDLKQAEAELKEHRENLAAMVAMRTEQLQTANARLEADIDARRRTEESLRVSEHRFRLALANAPVSVAIQDLDLVYQWAYNQRTRRPEEIIGKKDADLFAPEDIPTILAAKRKVIETGAEVHTRQWVTSHGQRMFLDLYYEPTRDASGNITGIGIASLDLTELKAVEEKLRSNETRLRLALDAANAGVWVWDLRTNKNEWSDELWELYGLDPHSCSPSYDTWLSAVHPEDREMVEQKVKEAVAISGNTDIEYRTIGRNGEIRWHASLGRPRFDDQNRAISYIGITMDVTRRKLSEAALFRSEKLASVGRLAATIAHEINNPLAAVTNALFLARMNAHDSESVTKFLDTADDELKRIAHITRQTLGFYRENSAATVVSMSSIMDSAIEVLHGKIKAMHASIEKQYRGDLDVMAKSGELRQVFANLLNNGLEALSTEGVIKVRISKSTSPKNGDARVRVSVADNGSGIDAANLAHIFEPFFTTKVSTGTGLGLWVASQIVEKHGGFIRIRSSQSGNRRGTVFSVVLPAAPKEAGVAPAS
jgi:PAS domain S-box-containing protein